MKLKLGSLPYCAFPWQPEVVERQQPSLIHPSSSSPYLGQWKGPLWMKPLQPEGTWLVREQVGGRCTCCGSTPSQRSAVTAAENNILNALNILLMLQMEDRFHPVCSAYINASGYGI